jgi:histone H3/H4
MHLDPEVARASGDAVVCVGKAVELFVELLASKCSRVAATNKRKTIKLDDFAAVIK